MAMHPGPVVTKDRFRHKCRRLVVPSCYHLHYILILQELISYTGQCVKSHIYLILTGSCHFMMLGLDLYTALLHLKHHLGSQVLHGIHRRYREITLLISWFISEVWAFLP